jgi:hypothetical protein
VPEVLTRRALNRATLARQLLLERAALPVPQALEQICGLQAQTPHSWYYSLWSRVAGFDPGDAAALLVSRDIVRVALMRSTIHLVTARDCLGWRALVEPVIMRSTRGAFGRRWKDLDLDAVAARGRELLETQSLTFAALGRELAGYFPGRDTSALCQLVRAKVPLVQVPPRGLWGRSGPVAHTSAEHWLGAAQAPVPIEEFIARYLAGFGPATAMDVQAHCGLTRLREVLDRMDLRTFHTEEGKRLYDLDEAPRPHEDVPAPVRFLPDFDNVLISFADRSRMGTLDPAQSARAWPEHGPVPGTVLIDGTVGATWSLTEAKGTATVTITPFRRVDADEVTAEGARLLEFARPGAVHEVRIASPW